MPAEAPSVPFESNISKEVFLANVKKAKEYITSGDIIVAYDGTPVGSVDDLHRLLGAERIGKETVVTILRRTHKLELPVCAEELA